MSYMTHTYTLFKPTFYILKHLLNPPGAPMAVNNPYTKAGSVIHTLIHIHTLINTLIHTLIHIHTYIPDKAGSVNPYPYV
jgi:hypothetical protein